MKEKFERFKNEKIVINVRSPKQYDDFMKMCEEQGLKWGSEDLPTTINHYNFYKEETCINLNYLKKLSYSDIDFFKNEGYKIITYKDFMKKSNQFTKSDLKDNHIVIFESGHKRLWGDIAYKERYKENLSHKYVDNYSINEVWEFDKLVWKREILDEVEKKYLSDVIRPFRNKIIWIKKDALHDNSDEEWIKIKMNKERMLFPSFKKGKMYKGMEIYKEYSLEDLGL